VSAVVWLEETTWVTTESLPTDRGTAIALDGQGANAMRLVVDSPWYSTNGSMAGAISIYAFSEEGWKLDETLGSPDMEPSIYWGVAMEFSEPCGDLLLVAGQIQ
jgi:hypothetical protein